MSEHTKDDVTAEMMLLVVLSSDSKTGATGKTLTDTRCKSGQHAYTSATGTVTECGNGNYAYLPAALDVDTLGDFALHATATSCDVVDEKWSITPAIPNASAIATAVGAPSAATIAGAVWSTAVITITGHATTALEVLRTIMRFLFAGKKSGPLQGTAGNVTIRDEADTKNFLVVPVDITGYETGAPPTYDPT